MKERKAKEIAINIADFVENKCNHDQLLEQVEPVYFRELLRHTGGNKSQAARIAGLHRDTFCRKLAGYGITVELQVRIKEGKA